MSHPADPLAGLSNQERRQLLLRLLEQQQATPDVAPLSSAQARLWFLDQLVPNSPFYNVSLAFRMHGPLADQSLVQSLDGVVQRHEILRTHFDNVAGRPQQVVANKVSIPQPLVDLRHLPQPAGAAEAQRLTRAAARRPFRLDRGPLLRALLLRPGDAEHHLVLTLHHILADGWSMGVLYRELTTLYNTLRTGGALATALPELPIQYADFAVWQRDWLAGADCERQLAWWREHLHEAPQRLRLPHDHARPDHESFRGAQHGFALDASLALALDTLSRQRGVTLFMTLLAAFAALLYRLTGDSDLVLGAPIANRHRQEVEPLIGLFVNTLALRLKPAGRLPFERLLRQAESTALGAFAHQDLPFERLIESLEPERSLSHNPLCQVLFALQNYPAETLRLGDLELEPLAESALDTGTAKFDLTLYFWHQPQGLTGLFEYNVDLFEASTIERLAGHLEVLLQAIHKDPQTPLDHLPLLRPAERRQMLTAWNPGPESSEQNVLPRLGGQEADPVRLVGATLATFFTQSALAHATAPALRFADGELTYHQLAERANLLAQRLRRLGVGNEVRVGLAVERSASMVVAMVGIALAGGAYVPLDPSYPTARLAFMVEDADVAVVVCDGSTAGDLGGTRPRLILGAAGHLVGDLEILSTAPPTSTTHGDQAAYVIYTSGSTGRPKGVVITQRAILRRVLHTDYVQLTSHDVVAQASNAAFDAATWEIWGALLNGALLVGIGREIALSPADFAATLERQGITALFLTTALFNQMAVEQPRAFADLRHLLFGGELVDPEKVRRVLASGPPERLLHVYGPTECTTFAAWHPICEAPASDPTVPIGGPLASTSLQVVDGVFEPVPLGIPGELLVGGPGLARGYLGHPARTALTFVPDPFTLAADRGERLYRTGDLVRRRRDGALEFLGRVDQQVKIRGFRVEPGEIESELLRHQDVQEAIVLAHESETADGTRDRRLAAYIASRPPTGDEGGQVEAWRAVYDDAIYEGIDGGEGGVEDPVFNLTGWTSSFTGEAIPAEEMRQQVEGTLERLRALCPRRVLEIGCGTGLLLFPLAPTCARYWGSDFSRVALDYLERQLATAPLPQVRLFASAADDFHLVDAALAEEGAEPFDLVLLNSVTQYFPSAEYLETVLGGALERLAPGGTIFLGDVRFLPLARAQDGALESHRASPDLNRSGLRARLAAAAARETELLLAPAFFHALGHLSELLEVRIWPKRGRGNNELARFRCDVLLRRRTADEPARRPTASAAQPWPQDWGVEELRSHLLAAPTAQAMVFKDVPNARLAEEGRLLAWLDDDRGAATLGGSRRRAGAGEGIHPEDLWQMAEELAWHIELSWARGDEEGRFDLFAWRRGEAAPPAPPLAASGPPANQPMAAQQRQQLVPRLRRFLADRLPPHLLPTSFLVLDALPLNANGKVDRAALASLEETFGDDPLARPLEAAFAAPRSPAEQALARIWSDVLGISPVGAHDHFFELGGHSLLATQVASRVRATFHIELPLATLFEQPVLSTLAATVEALLMEALADMDEDQALALLTTLESPQGDHHGD